jgi:FkbM family methyltransferase
VVGKKMRKVFIDGGARIGESLLSGWLKSREELYGCDVYLYEPSQQCQDKLNEIKNKYLQYNITIKQECLWTANCTAELFNAIDIYGDLGNTLFPDKKEKLDKENPQIVKCVDILDVINSFYDDDYIVLKLDVEGAEYDIVQRLLSHSAIYKIKELHVEWHDAFFDDKNSKDILRELAEKNIPVFNWELRDTI